MTVRASICAGRFYDGSPADCRRHAEQLVQAEPPEGLPGPLYGGLVPHAGWVFSGALAGRTLRALHADAGGLETVVLFGADHTGMVRAGEVWPEGAWRTPLGDVAIDEHLAAALLASGDLLRANTQAHLREHSIEVQVPLVQVLAPEAKIVPIAVPPTAQAVEIGQVVAKVLAESFPAARVVGSTDLTHHGGHFPAPGGRGAQSEKYARQNDRRMLDRIEALDAEGVTAEAAERQNACGPGAVAAAIAACKQRGATRGITLDYTNSYEITHRRQGGGADDTAVGYAAVVFA